MSDYTLSPQPVQSRFIESDADIVFFGGGGGGGKTWAILVDNLRFIEDPNYFSVFFRNTTTELETNLWPEAKKLYEPLLRYQSGPNKGKFIGKANIRDKDHTIVFPSGAKSKFAYLQYDKDADSWYGAEISRAYFDEFHRFTEYQFHIIRSRLRSKAGVKSCMRCTLNPDPNHFCLDYVKPFLDEEGYPVKKLSGKIRYFVIEKGEMFSSWKLSDLKRKFPKKTPKTYTYIPATLEDNEVLLQLEPDYKDTLDSLPEVKRKQLLLGCWYVDDNDTMFFNREWLHKASEIPSESKCVRAWDKAYTEPSPTNRYPDYTASVKMYKCKQGFYYIAGASRFRKKPGERDREIIRQGHMDGRECYIVPSVDNPSSGKFELQQFTKALLEEGLLTKKDPMPTNKNKLKRFEPFSIAAQNGLVYILEHTFDPDMLKIFYSELESFNGERSNSHQKDDLVDACASAFNVLAQEKVIPSFSLPGSGVNDRMTGFKTDIHI